MRSEAVATRILLFTAIMLLGNAPSSVAQRTRVYASVISSGKFIVGAANAGTGLFHKAETDDTTWIHTGPQRIRANGFAVDPRSGGETVYIASGNGVLRSKDAGATWRLLTGWRVTEVLGSALDPHNLGSMAIATAYGVFRSTDDGENWLECNTGRRFPPFTPTVLYDPAVPGRLLCSAEDGIYISVDGGSRWELSVSVPRGVRTIARHPRRSDLLAAGTEEDGMFVSTDGGMNWAKRPASGDVGTVYAVAFVPDADSSIYIGGFEAGVHLSTDLGETWDNRSTGLNVPTVHALAVDPADSRRMYAGTIWGGIFRSEDSGATWRYAGLMDSQVVSISFIEF